MRVNVGRLRPVVACLLAGFLVVGAAQPAAAAPRRAEQWYLDELRIDRVHKISTGRGVVVAVVDTGVEASHPDLRGQVLPGGRSYGASGDGRADEVGHGTHMAGIIAAKPSGDGVDGIAPGAKILPIKMRKEDGVYTDAEIARGIRMAVDGGAKVINVSIGSPGFANPVQQSAIQYALDRDVVLVASAGNTAQGRTTVGKPANTPGVIAVTGTTRGGAFWSGSVQGPEAVVAAPGDGIYNVANEGGYGWGDGTSDSSAIVSGLAALIRSKYPDLSAPNVINRIIRTARDAGASGRDPQYGFGVIDPTRALTANVPPVTANPLLDPAVAATDPGPGRAEGADEEFDVTQHGDRGGPTDQQVMVVGIGIAVVLVLLLGLVVFLIWNRRRYRREAARAADIPDEVLDRVAQGAYPPPDAGYAPPPGYPPPPGYAPPAGYAPPSGYAPPPGYTPPPPSGYGPPPGGSPPAPPSER
ncbi:type VII secretion-associated serine protease mycosin [Micromonospora sp. NPDC049089]|uniref:type VII secretion-associated serine protease mycosin n=1 Tax=Micromonospora sp. NPDC049089 TaxID=3155496 RepID=UPI0033FA3EB1